MSEPRQPVSVGPLPDPSEDPVAGRLVEVLESEAGRIEPGERLDRVRAAAVRPRRHWQPLVAGIAAVALVGGGSWALLDRDRGSSPRPPTTPIAASPTPTPTSTPTVSPSATSGTAALVPVTVPVYYLGQQVKGLFREFQRTTAPAKDPERTVEQALRLAVNPSAPTRPGDVSPWLPGTSAALQVEFVNTEQLFVFLPAQEQQAHGRTAEQARLAAQQLVWTATATLQDPQLSVRILFGDSAGRLFGTLSTKPLFHRPPNSLAYQDLSAIWILQPADGATEHGTLTVSGQACTFEANVAWQVRSGRVSAPGPAPVRSGRLTASAGCPVRGTWSLTLAGLRPGSYTFVAYEPSPKGDGSYEGLDSVRFTVP